MTLSGRFLLLGLSCIAPLALHAQSVGPSAIDAAGRSVTVGGNTHDYSVGQVVAGNTFVSASLTVTPGVLQPDVDAASGVAAAGFGAGDIQVYPGPAITTLYIRPAFGGKGVLRYSLYDAAGKLVVQHEASLATGQELQSLDVAAAAAGQYLLHVSWQQGGLSRAGVYKVQKLK